MILPVMDFLPSESRRAVHAVRSKRRIALLGILLLVFSVGVSAHSWNSARNANSERSVGAMLVANAPGIDELMDEFAKEQSSLSHALSITDGLVPAISASSVVASITHMLPDHVTLTGMRLETIDAPHQMTVVMSGVSANNTDLPEFERKLAACPAFRGVTVSESKVGEFMGKRVEEFKVSLQVPLFVKVCKPGTMHVAQGGVN
jgi:hypothetical protein